MFIREGVSADDSALEAIDHASWSPLTDPSEHWPLERPFFGPITSTRPEDVLVAEADHGTPLGVIKIVPAATEFGDWCVNGLSVATDAQGNGIGAALILAACQRATERGGTRVWLKVLDSNERAVRLYARLGFSEVARFVSPFENRPGVDDLRMAADLPLAGE